ncbi:MAG: RNA polymerase sigma factor [Phycisphaerales bacterium]
MSVDSPRTIAEGIIPRVAEQRPPSDAELVEAANAGDSSALATLYERHRDFVHGVAWRMLGDGDLAAEVVQEVFLWWIGRFPGFVLTSRLTTFLYAATRSRSIDLARKRRRMPRGGLDGEEIAGAPPSRAVSLDRFDAPSVGGDDAGERLCASIGRLPVIQQEVLLLRFVQDLSLEEIASALDIPLGTVKSRLHAAVRAVRGAPQSDR